jgi:hypothetical protein
MFDISIASSFIYFLSFISQHILQCRSQQNSSQNNCDRYRNIQVLSLEKVFPVERVVDAEYIPQN